MNEQEDHRLNNPFSESTSPPPTPNSSDFIAFSSTPNHERQFKPRRGKNNRLNNWQRFGESPYGNNRGGNWSNNYRGTPHQNRGGRWNNSTPHFYSNQGGGGDDMNYRNNFNRGRGHYNHRGRGDNSFRGGHQRGNKKYFHPSMLEDPWKHLMNESNNETTGNDFPKINPAPELNEDDLSESLQVNVSERVDSSIISEINESSLLNESGVNIINDTVDDSMNVQIGDSILEQTTS